MSSLQQRLSWIFTQRIDRHQDPPNSPNSDHEAAASDTYDPPLGPAAGNESRLAGVPCVIERCGCQIHAESMKVLSLCRIHRKLRNLERCVCLHQAAIDKLDKEISKLKH